MIDSKPIYNKKYCPFCNLGEQEIIDENQFAICIYDKFPVTDKHILIIPKKHFENFFDATKNELIDMWNLLELCKLKIQREDNTITGFNIGVNCLSSAGQTVPHCHIHLIPRRDGDMKNPEGGVRGCIPKKRKYIK